MDFLELCSGKIPRFWAVFQGWEELCSLGKPRFGGDCRVGGELCSGKIPRFWAVFQG